jgi:hypothetical protein
MIRLLALTALGVLALAGPARSQGTPPARPEGRPPTQAEAIFKDGGVQFTLTATVFEIKKEARVKKLPDGKEVTEYFDIPVPVKKEFVAKMNPKAIFQRASGQAIDAKDLPSLLEKPTMIFVSADGKKLDPFYLQFLAGDAIIAIPPPVPVAVPGSGEETN